MVNVWASSHGLALGQTKVDEKSMKSPPSPSCYSCWSSPKSIITIDAGLILPEGDSPPGDQLRLPADYLLAVKENPRRRCCTMTFATFSRASLRNTVIRLGVPYDWPAPQR